MALEFKKTEAIKFGDIVAVPQLTTELRLRVQKVPMEDLAQLDEAKDLLASCFGDKKSEVRAFMDAEMSIVDLRKLQAYFVGGDDMLDTLEKQMAIAMEKVEK